MTVTWMAENLHRQNFKQVCRQFLQVDTKSFKQMMGWFLKNLLQALSGNEWRCAATAQTWDLQENVQHAGQNNRASE